MQYGHHAAWSRYRVTSGSTPAGRSKSRTVARTDGGPRPSSSASAASAAASAGDIAECAASPISSHDRAGPVGAVGAGGVTPPENMSSKPLRAVVRAPTRQVGARAKPRAEPTTTASANTRQSMGLRGGDE